MTTLQLQVNTARKELLAALDERYDPQLRQLAISNLKRAVASLEALGYSAGSFAEVIHVYRSDLTEHEVWRNGNLIGLDALSPAEWQAVVYNRLFESAQSALDRKHLKLAKYYTDGLITLKQLWGVIRLEREVSPTGVVRRLKLICSEQ